MLVADALSSHVRNAPLLAGSKTVPSAFLRFSATSIATSVGPTSAWPFLFDQNPRVWPPPARRQRLPNSTVFVSPSATVTLTGLGVVPSQFVSIGVNSVTT